MVSTKNDMISWAFIFEAPETNPQVDRMVIERGGMRPRLSVCRSPLSYRRLPLNS